MNRFPAYDPPEYVNWKPNTQIAAEFSATLERDPRRSEVIRALPEDRLMDLYRGLLRTRLHDIMLKRWVKLGVISKAWLGTGEEAVTVGAVHALDRSQDVVAPMIRNAGACCEMGMPVSDMLRAYLATADSPSLGRDGPAGSMKYRVLPPISNIGDMPPVLGGIALSFKIRREPRVALTWIGDGSVAAGPCHEAFNFAAVSKLPIVFVIQNNQVALGTPANHHHVGGEFSDLPAAYGMSGEVFDGNNVLDTYAAVHLAATQCRSGNGPVMLCAQTFRMGGHATHDEAEARQVLLTDLFDFWGKRDPVGMFETYLTSQGRTAVELEAVEAEVTNEVDAAAQQAIDSRQTSRPVPESATAGVYSSS